MAMPQLGNSGFNQKWKCRIVRWNLPSVSNLRRDQISCQPSSPYPTVGPKSSSKALLASPNHGCSTPKLPHLNFSGFGLHPCFLLQHQWFDDAVWSCCRVLRQQKKNYKVASGIGVWGYSGGYSQQSCRSLLQVVWPNLLVLIPRRMRFLGRFIFSDLDASQLFLDICLNSFQEKRPVDGVIDKCRRPEENMSVMKGVVSTRSRAAMLCRA
jgi:hypothetical protein